MPKLSKNALVRRRWQEAQAVVRSEEQRSLTQQEFLDVAFGVNPRTGKPYNPRTLRKWMSGERSADRAVERSKSATHSFQQFVEIDGNVYAPTLTKPSGHSGLDLWTKTGRKQVRKAARKRMEERVEQTQNLPDTVTREHKNKDGTTTIETYRPARSTRGLKTRKARAVGKQRAGVIITRRQRAPITSDMREAA